jgi:hypothetical protein
MVSYSADAVGGVFGAALGIATLVYAALVLWARRRWAPRHPLPSDAAAAMTRADRAARWELWQQRLLRTATAEERLLVAAGFDDASGALLEYDRRQEAERRRVAMPLRTSRSETAAHPPLFAAARPHEVADEFGVPPPCDRAVRIAGHGGGAHVARSVAVALAADPAPKNRWAAAQYTPATVPAHAPSNNDDDDGAPPAVDTDGLSVAHLRRALAHDATTASAMNASAAAQPASLATLTARSGATFPAAPMTLSAALRPFLQQFEVPRPRAELEQELQQQLRLHDSDTDSDAGAVPFPAVSPVRPPHAALDTSDYRFDQGAAYL